MINLENKIAIVTGAARGIGAAIATKLAKEGAAVVLTDVLVEIGEQTASEINQSGGRAVFKKLNVTDQQAWQALFDFVIAEFGRLDILVNNAGIDLQKTIEEATVEDFEKIMNVNVYGPFIGIKGAIKLMKETGGGSIVNISSIASKIVSPTTTVYSPSKSALAMLTKTVATHCGFSNYNIRVNSVHPGFVETDMICGGENPVIEKPMMQAAIQAVPLQRLSKPEEIANAVAFLASDESSYMTGAEVVVDGGKTLM